MNQNLILEEEVLEEEVVDVVEELENKLGYKK
jgi:hypothetical protein